MDRAASALASLLKGLVLGKPLTDAELRFPAPSDGQQSALPIFSRPLGEGHGERAEEILGEGGGGDGGPT